jgi:hypothetical protein
MDRFVRALEEEFTPLNGTRSPGRGDAEAAG